MKIGVELLFLTSAAVLLIISIKAVVFSITQVGNWKAEAFNRTLELFNCTRLNRSN